MRRYCSDKSKRGWCPVKKKGARRTHRNVSRSTTDGKNQVLTPVFFVPSQDVQCAKQPSSSPRFSGPGCNKPNFCDFPSLSTDTCLDDEQKKQDWRPSDGLNCAYKLMLFFPKLSLLLPATLLTLALFCSTVTSFASGSLVRADGRPHCSHEGSVDGDSARGVCSPSRLWQRSWSSEPYQRKSCCRQSRLWRAIWRRLMVVPLSRLLADLARAALFEGGVSEWVVQVDRR